MGNTRRTFTREFKERAVNMVVGQGLPFSRVASDLGVPEGSLRRWAKELEQHAEKAFPGRGLPIEKELVRLQRELAIVREERDILKKATIFFARYQK